ncbi:hypothetical protein NDA01_31315, partial [Trichocoleus desertorum AS-A10]|uniref:hypothetical protein n=1 Tax=Trichocoleus desertorum TaxID=1481672 RepID=UPI003298DAD4
GVILIGKHKGQEIGIALRDELFDHWSPLMAADVLEQDGTTRTYLLDGSNWVLYEREALCNFEGIWVGDRISTTINGSNTATTTLKPPYLEVDVLEAGLALAAQITDYPYSLDAGTDLLQAGLGIGSQIIDTPPLTDTLQAGLGLGAQIVETLPPSGTLEAGLGLGARILDNENDTLWAGLGAGARVVDEAIADQLEAGLGLGARVIDGAIKWQDLSFSDWQNLDFENWKNLEF